MMILLRVWLILSWSAAAPLNPNVDNDDIPSIDTVNGDGVDRDGLHIHALENTNRDAKHAFYGGDINFSGTIDSSGNHAGINIGSISSNAASQHELQAVDGGWSNWGNYGQCSKECEGGIQTRTRTCTNPVKKNKGRTCEQQNIGKETETRDCNLQACVATNLPGIWSVAFTNGARNTFTIKPDGEISWFGRNTLLKPSDDQINFPSSEGWMKGEKLIRIATWSYYRIAEDGTLKVEHFYSDGASESNNFQNLDHYCCSGIGHRQDSLDKRSPSCSFDGDLIEPLVSDSGQRSPHDTDVLFQWKNNIIPYYYSDQNTKVADKDLIRNVMNTIEKKTCFMFREINKEDHEEKHILQIVIEPEPCSYTVTGSVDEDPDNIEGLLMKLTAQVTDENGENCGYKGLILHELMHVLGVQHTQRRSDRDEFITVMLHNLPSANDNLKNQYRKCANCTSYKNIPYDCDSIMHYGTHINGIEVIIPKNTSTCKLKNYNKFYDDAFADGTYTDWKLLNLIGKCTVCPADQFSDGSDEINCEKTEVDSYEYNYDDYGDYKDSYEYYGDYNDSYEYYGDYVEDYYAVPGSGCRDDQISCTSGECKDNFLRCDGENDCEDGSDEINCEEDTVCNTDTFQCASGQQCIKPKWRCDGIRDCEDGSDEMNCETVCTDDLSKCSSGECIYPEMRCDGDYDCKDGSDEDQKECQELACEDKQFFCAGKCIPLKLKCDGYEDCTYGEDEINCPGKVWRDDGRCGTDSGTGIEYLLPNGKPAQCNPTSNWPCCSKEGWCGNTAQNCHCDGCKSYKGILNIEAVTKYTKSTQAMGDKLQKLREESGDITISHEEVKLETKMVETRMYLKDKCESEKGVCESEKIDRFTEESESIFQNIQKTGMVSLNFLKSFEKQKKKLDKAAEEVKKIITGPKKLWRDDARCGPEYTLPSGEPAQCDKTNEHRHCCSQWGSCGEGPAWCECIGCVNYAECTCSGFVDEKGFGKCQTGDETLFEGSPYCYVNLPSNCTDLVESQTNPKKWRSAEACTFSDVSGGEETEGCSFNDNTLARRILPNGKLSPYDSTENYRWNNKKIPYYFAEEHTSDTDKEEVRKVMLTIKDKTCFKFKEKDNNLKTWKKKHSLEIKIKSTNACKKPCNTGGSVDKRKGQGKGLVLSFNRKLTNSNGDCGCKNVILHELMHVLGVAHTQKRADRDYTITVANLDHKDKNFQDQYTICDPCKLYKGIPYDCDSIMHYGMGTQIIVPKNTNCTLKKMAKYKYPGFSASKTDWKLLNRIGHCD